MRFHLFLFILLITLIGSIALAQSDGIPDNCEFIEEYSNQFIRYEPQNRHLVLVDWATGQDIRVIANDLDNTIILGWSVNCRYIAAAVGSSSSMDTTVWDVQTGERMGSVPDAHNQAHHITWGSDDYLVVETRNGAILWHVRTYKQSSLTSHFDPITVRNFSRLRWDAANGQLIANLAGSGRVVYDLYTGQEVPQVASQTDTYPIPPESQVIVGGGAYDCGGGYRYGYRYWFSSSQNAPSELSLRFNQNTQQIYVDLYNNSAPKEVLVVLENNVSISSFQGRGWSADCRYAAASLGQIGHDATDTYVWDVTTGQRVGVLEDARDIVHPLYWHPSQAILLAETRNGAVLWNLQTNQQTILDTGAETALAGYSDIRNFKNFSWAKDFLFLVPINAPQSIHAYHISTGDLASVHTIDPKISFILPSPNGTYALICCNEAKEWVLWKRDTSIVVPLLPSIPARYNYSNFYFNPTEQYMTIYTLNGVYVWDLAATDGTPFAHYPHAQIDFRPSFIDETTLAGNSSQINIVTGEYSVFGAVPQVPIHSAALTGETGFNLSRSECRKNIYFNGQVPENPQLNEYGIYNGATYLFSIQTGRYVSHSPDCRWLYAEVPYFTPNSAYDNALVDDTYREALSDYLVFWDVSTGEVIHSFYHPYRFQTYTRVSWSPDSQYAVVQTTEGAYLYHPTSDTATMLVFNTSDDAIRSYFRTYWDFERGFVLVEGWQAIYAFDIATGTFLYKFTSHPTKLSRCSYWGCGIHIVNNQYLVVGDMGTIGIWNLNTLESHFISTKTPEETWYRNRYSRLHISPSGRFVVNVRRDVRIAVWDLENLEAEIDARVPYFLPLKNVGERVEVINFVDNETVELILSDGTSYQLSLLKTTQ